MRLDYRHAPYTVWHAELCQNIANRVRWLDTATAQYCEILQPVRVEGQEVATRVVQARKIEVYEPRRLAVINPIEDTDGQSEEAATENTA